MHLLPPKFQSFKNWIVLSQTDAFFAMQITDEFVFAKVSHVVQMLVVALLTSCVWRKILNGNLDWFLMCIQIYLPDAALKVRNDMLTLHKQSTADFLYKVLLLCRLLMLNYEIGPAR